MEELSELKRMILKLSDRQIMKLLGLQKLQSEKTKDAIENTSGRWIDKKLYGLDDEGMAYLKELETRYCSRLISLH